MIKFKDLSGWMKLAAIGGIAYAAVFAFQFCVGFVYGFSY
tara:strand:- start:227 stop:346 length:120 start_codon:yes stop_codon:yes gene_type:complete